MSEPMGCGQVFMLNDGPHHGQLIKVMSLERPIIVHDAGGEHTYIPDPTMLPFLAHWKDES